MFLKLTIKVVAFFLGHPVFKACKYGIQLNMFNFVQSHTHTSDYYTLFPQNSREYYK